MKKLKTIATCLIDGKLKTFELTLDLGVTKTPGVFVTSFVEGMPMVDVMKGLKRLALEMENKLIDDMLNRL